MRRWIWVLVLFLWPAALSAQSALEIEQNLSAIGYDVGTVDGLVDSKSTRAVHMFQYHFGFPVSAQLTPRQVRFLQHTVALSQLQDPFVVQEPREQTSSEEEILLSGSNARFDRVIYANGAHYLAKRGYFQYNAANSKLKSTFTTPALNLSNERRATHMDRAYALARQTGNTLAQALITLSDWDTEGTGVTDTLNAFELVLQEAKATGDVAYLSALAEGANARTRSQVLCRTEPRLNALGLLLMDAMAFADASGMPPFLWSALTVTALACAPEERRDDVYKIRATQAQRVSNEVEARVRRNWAANAFEGGRFDVAREQYANVIALAGERPEDAFFEVEGLLWSLLEWTDILALNALGMTAERDLAAERLIVEFEASPDPGPETSRAETAYYYWLQVHTGTVFLELGRFDYLRRQGAKIAADDWRPGGAIVGNVEQGSVWEGGVLALRTMLSPEGYPDLIRLGEDLLPHVLDSGEWHVAAEVSLLRAEAAAAIGDYATAEPALVNAVTYATNAGLTDRLSERADEVRQSLAVFELSQLRPAERAVEQMRAFYGDDCSRTYTGEPRNDTSFPAIDFVSVSRDELAAETFVASGAMDMMLSCLSKLEDIFWDETRMLCAVGAYVGRKDVSDYIFNPSVPKNPYNYGPDRQRSCIEGLALAGKPEWANPHVPPNETGWSAQNLRFMAMPPDQRRAATQSMNPDRIETLDLWDIDLRELSIDRTPERRADLMRELRSAFWGGHGNMGPQESDYENAYMIAVAYQRMGLYNAAEAQMYIDDIVDPLAFGSESEEALTADLLNLPAVAKRLDYAHLYRDQGRFDDAQAAIGPLVELAVARLSSDETPLPGTVEQWSSRLQPAFEFYLSLQFEPLSQGPNYPALFLVQQYLQLASSTASLSVLEQRLGSASPSVAREIQDIQRQIRNALQSQQADLTELQLLNDRMAAAQAKLPQDDAAFSTHQIGVVLNLGDTAKALRESGASLIFITQLPEQMIVTKVDGQSAVARQLDITERASQSAVRRFRQGIQDSTEARDAFEFGLASTLYEELIGWGFDGAPAPDLRFVIDGPQITLPLGALRHEDDWLAVKSSLRIAPSVARASQNMVRTERAEGFVGLGHPNLTTGDTARREALLGAASRLPELPETASELAFMALAFGGNPTRDVFVQDVATEQTIGELNASDRLSNTSILALATHGLLSAETGQLNQAALVLSVPSDLSEDGLLTASEIYSLRIGADLVILSACNTGTPNAEVGLSELSSAFLYSGSKGLMLTHWEIDSGAGVEIMKRFATSYRAASEGRVPDLLQNAIADMLQDETAVRFHHPKFWASHFVMG